MDIDERIASPILLRIRRRAFRPHQFGLRRQPQHVAVDKIQPQ
jgi:hypothetical protein